MIAIKKSYIRRRNKVLNGKTKNIQKDFIKYFTIWFNEVKRSYNDPNLSSDFDPLDFERDDFKKGICQSVDIDVANNNLILNIIDDDGSIRPDGVKVSDEDISLKEKLRLLFTIFCDDLIELTEGANDGIWDKAANAFYRELYYASGDKRIISSKKDARKFFEQVDKYFPVWYAIINDKYHIEEE